jgi:hypothetical protein
MTTKPIPTNATDPRRVRLGGYAKPATVPGPVRASGPVRLGGYLPSN